MSSNIQTASSRDDRRTPLYVYAWSLLFALMILALSNPARADFTATITNGTGGGTYAAGAEVFVSAYPCENDCPEQGGLESADPAAPKRIFSHWSGDAEGLLDNPTSADTRLIMPTRNAALQAIYTDAPRWTPPTVITNFPVDYHGVIFMNHGGTGCAQCFWKRIQTRRFVDDAASRGLAVVAVDSFDRAAKEWEGTGFQDPSDPENNIDMQRLAAVRQQLIADGRMLASDPVYLVGVSNGGVFSSLFTQEAQDYLDFPVDAMAFVISSGSPTETPSQTVPIFFALAENDSAPDGAATVNNTAIRHFDALLKNGIPTQLHIAREWPVNPDSFWRIEGLSQTDSNTIYQAFATAGVIDAQGWLVENPHYSTWSDSVPKAYVDYQSSIEDVLWVHYAEHKFHNQFSDQLFTFLENPQTVVGMVPVITDFTPNSGSPGTVVTITGDNFVGVESVTINGEPVEILGGDLASVVIRVPETATSGPIYVTNAGGTGASAEPFAVILTPVIDSFDPVEGKPRAMVIISGDNLAGVTAAAVNGESAAIFPISDAVLRITVPDAATTGSITLTNAAGSVDSATPFTVDRTPEVTDFTPASGPPGTIVVISGSGFVDSPVVKIGGKVAETVYAQPTQLRARVDADAVTGSVQVTNASGTTAATSDFTVIHPAPVITEFNPILGVPGTVVKIDGANLSAVNSVTFGGVPAEIVGQAPSSVRVKVPQNGVTGTIGIADPWNSAQSTGTFEVLSAPTISSYTPDRGPHGTVVTVTGTGFRYLTSVKLGSVAVPYTVVSETQIDVTITGTGLPQYSPIFVNTQGGSARTGSVFILQ